MSLESGATWIFDAQIVGRNNAGASAGYQFTGVIEKYSGTTAFLGSTNLVFSREDVGG
jgi:hypothetical protein